MMKMIIGYTTGVYDLFHVGHINILENAKRMCDKLIVGVTTDELVKYKHKTVVIPFEERCKIVSKYADVVVPQENMNKVDAYKRYKFDIMFVGDDWYKTDKWEKIEESLKKHGVIIIFLPYTKSTSSTLINEVLLKLRK